MALIIAVWNSLIGNAASSPVPVIPNNAITTIAGDPITTIAGDYITTV